MISDLDRTIRQILIQQGGFEASEIDISFEVPRRDWSAGISRPTINCYLFDIRENTALSEDGWSLERGRGQEAQRRRTMLRFDLAYQITAWTRAVEDEHRLLWHILQTLVRFPVLPDELLQGRLRQHELPIYARAGRPAADLLKSSSEFWSALENLLKPSLSYTVTLAMDREAIPAGPPVMTSSFQFRTPAGADTELGLIGGTVRDAAGQPVVGAAVSVVGHHAQATTDEQGGFRLARLAPGSYTLRVQHGEQTSEFTLGVPSERYEVRLEA